MDKQENEDVVIDVAIPSDSNTEMKEHELLELYHPDTTARRNAYKIFLIVYRIIR